MVKSQPDQVFIVTSVISQKKGEDLPPKIPPRMKKNGPALPEKPPHIRAALKAQSQNLPSQPPREPLRPRAPHNNNVLEGREVLVAASRAVRERPVEKRQREPAKLLMPTTGIAKKEVKREDRIVKKLDYHPLKSESNSKTHESHKKSSRAAVPQPLLLIPRGLLTTWTPVSYALWTQRGPRLEPGPKGAPGGHASSTSRQQRSSSVARSGSLTSQGSSSSDSGNETFPKSVLKKQKRGACPATNKGGSCSNRDQKKNVTFNAFATVQLMEE